MEHHSSNVERQFSYDDIYLTSSDESNKNNNMNKKLIDKGDNFDASYCSLYECLFNSCCFFLYS
jgi:hypothetical protein